MIFIRLYLNFNTSNVTIQLFFIDVTAGNNVISIHLMLLFNLCWIVLKHLILYFNTSNVTIQQNPSCYLWKGFIISIHLMLLFNKGYFNIWVLQCFISIHLMLLFNSCCPSDCRHAIQISIHLMLLFNELHNNLDLKLIYFNTSNVTIQL